MQNFLISANSFAQCAGIAALSKEGDEAVARMRAVYDKRRKLMGGPVALAPIPTEGC